MRVTFTTDLVGLYTRVEEQGMHGLCTPATADPASVMWMQHQVRCAVLEEYLEESGQRIVLARSLIWETDKGTRHDKVYASEPRYAQMLKGYLGASNIPPIGRTCVWVMLPMAGRDILEHRYTMDTIVWVHPTLPFGSNTRFNGALYVGVGAKGGEK